MSEEKINETEEQAVDKKDEKLKNQSSELDYLTNTIIPKLKEENSKLKSLKGELSDALENCTEKYFVQLDINADLSEKLTKTGAENALNKVKLDKVQNEIKTIKDDAEAKVKEMEKKLGDYNPATIDKLKDEKNSLEKSLKEATQKVTEMEEVVPKLKGEIDDYRRKIIEIGDYKEEVEAETKGTINKLQNEISKLNTDLKIRQSSYDKLKAETDKTIKNLEKEIKELKESAAKEESKGFFGRLKK